MRPESAKNELLLRLTRDELETVCSLASRSPAQAALPRPAGPARPSGASNSSPVRNINNRTGHPFEFHNFT